VLSSTNSITGRATTNAYSSCCALDSSRDADGIWTTNTYNDLKQVIAVDRLDVSTTYGYDVHGNVLWTQKEASGAPTIVTHSAYDQLGRLTATTNELDGVTTYAYSTNGSGERVVTTTFPDSATRIETYYLDGQLKLVSGTAVQTNFYEYGADSTGTWTTVYSGPDDSASEWVKTYVDMAGRTCKLIYPDGHTETTAFNDKGQAVRRSDAITTHLTGYNDLGEASQTAIDMDADNTIDTDQTDRITETVTSYVSSPEDAQQTVSYTYPTNSSGATLEISRQLRAVDGADTWSIALGRTNHTSVARDPANVARTETLTHPDLTQTVSHYTNNLLMAVVRKSNAAAVLSTTKYTYDGYGRAATKSETAASGDTRTTTYAHDDAGNLTNVVVSGGTLSQTTGYVYDSMGRRTKTILPDAGEVDYTYNSKGELTQQTGARTYPVSYTYTPQGRLATMSTYRNGIGGSADTTTWSYDSQRGWLTSKEYADSSSVDYEYYDNGTLKKRTWDRGLTTEYRYDAGNSLTNVSYGQAGSTNTVSYTRDRRAQAASVTDEVGTHTLSYRDDGQLASATLPQLPASSSLEYLYDTTGRRTNLTLTVAGTAVSQNDYTYDSAGRLETVADSTNTATYSYASDAATVSTITLNNGADDVLAVTNTYDALNRLIQIDSAPAGTSTLSFAYSYNSANQRTTNTLADGSYWLYTYDSLGQVTGAKKYFSDDTPVRPVQFAYDFDTAGNREEVSSTLLPDLSQEAYTANNLNQYSQRTVPGVVLFRGTAYTGAVVNVRRTNEVAKMANRHDDYYWQYLTVDNTSSSVFSTNMITACLSLTTNAAVRTETREVFTPRTPEQFTYDSDGNLTSDGQFTNTWNGENRLTTIESLPAVPDQAKIRLEFTYDYVGRRVTKTVLSGHNGSGYQQTNEVTFVYDGWNLIAALDEDLVGGTTSTNFYLWGLDLSGSLQGAGGVGGLLATCQDGASYFACMDGNGNVMALVDATDGTLAGEYEYGPFGEPLKALGDAAEKNAVRFSSKYTDTESRLLYYGYRYLDPSTGRWPSRDPVQEKGGANIYGFVDNNALSEVDVIGLARIGSITVRLLGTVRWWLEEGFGRDIGFTQHRVEQRVLLRFDQCGVFRLRGKLTKPEFVVSFSVTARAKHYERYIDRLGDTVWQHESKHIANTMWYYSEYEKMLNWVVEKGCVCIPCFTAMEHLTAAYEKTLLGIRWFRNADIDDASYDGGKFWEEKGKPLFEVGEPEFRKANTEVWKACGFGLTAPSLH